MPNLDLESQISAMSMNEEWIWSSSRYQKINGMCLAKKRDIGIIAKSGMRHNSRVVIVRRLLQCLKRDVRFLHKYEAFGLVLY